jgi:outer membrane protein OmpA-like peptidoglycan-associated protein/osmotically-inducible protein OsmY
LLWIGANLTQWDTIRADLSSRALQGLSGGGQTWASVSVDGRDVFVGGAAPLPEMQRQAELTVATIHGVRRVVNATTLMAERSPYTFTATREANRLILTGFAPNEAARAALEQAARAAAPGSDISNQVQLARGAPAGFQALTSFALAQLGRLTTGSVTLTGTAFTFSGHAASTEAFDAVTRALRALPDGASLSRADLVPPLMRPFSFSATRSEGDVILSGYVPSEASRAAAVALAQSATGVPVVDRLQLASGAPAGFDQALTFALTQLGRLGAGVASIIDASISIEGRAATVSSHAALVTALRAPPQGFALSRAGLVPATVRPFVFNAEWRDRGLDLTGFVPDEDTRARVLAAASALQIGDVRDSLQIAVGAPARFTEMVEFGLSQARLLTAGRFSLSDATVSISGTAASADAWLALSRMGAKIPGGFSLGQLALTPPSLQPYVWQAQRVGNEVVFTGSVPDSRVREGLLAAARAAMPDVQLVDRMGEARGAPEGFEAAAAALIGQLSSLTSGIVNTIDSVTFVTGVARSPETFAQLSGAPANVAAGFTPGRVDIAPPTVRPYIWEAERNETSLVLSGFVPSAAVRTALLTTARAIPGLTIMDRMAIAAGQPTGFEVAARRALADLGSLTTGQVVLRDTDVQLRGLAPSEAVAAAVRASLSAPPPSGMSIRGTIDVPPPAPVSPAPEPGAPTELRYGGPAQPEAQSPSTPLAARRPTPRAQLDEAGAACQRTFDELLQQRIEFAVARADIDERSHALLDRLAATAATCPDRTIEVAGHTDSDGDEAMNQALSERRAQAVVSYLVARGVAASRLSAVGYGEIAPLAPNDSAENKARNRRIEFVVQ